MSRDHPCPECGFPASHHASPEQWLRHAEKAWLRRVTLGLRLSLFSARWLLGFVVATLLWLVASMVLELLIDLSVMGPNTHWVADALFWAAIAIGVAMHSVSCVLLSSPPGEPGPHSLGARRMLRLCGTSFAPGIAIGTLGGVLVGHQLPAAYATAAVLMAVSVVYLAAQLRWLQHLEFHTAGWRLDSPRRYRREHRRLWWLTVSVVALELFIWWPMGPDDAMDREGPDGPYLWWLVMLVAFLISTDAVTKPAIKTITGEYRAGQSGLESSADSA